MARNSKVKASTVRLKNVKVLEHYFCVVLTEQRVRQTESS